MSTLLILAHRCDRSPTGTLRDLFLNIFALTDNFQGRVQEPEAEPANVSNQRWQTTLNLTPEVFSVADSRDEYRVG